MITILFYDFEVFKYDWILVLIDMDAQKETLIVNNKDELERYYSSHKNDIWAGFNSRRYDQFILKGILAGFDPKEINDWIIVNDKPGWAFSGLLREFPLNNYDVMANIDRGLKVFEGFMGSDIRESSVPFDIDRKLTDAEIAETVKYCRHDVEQTIEVFLRRKADFDAQFGLLKMYKMPLSSISKTKVQLSAGILEAKRPTAPYADEFEITFPPTMQIKKYSAVVDWYKNKENRKYRVNPNDPKSKKMQLEINVAGVPHQFGWGGVHGALESYSGEGIYINMDVASLYPSLMIRYNLHSRSCNPSRYVQVRDLRLKYKAEKNPLQAALKLVLNGTYGAMKDRDSPLYDPLMANNVCVYGQLLLLDLMEHLEPYCKIIQSNTDGVLVKVADNKAFGFVDDVAWEWEKRTGLRLEFEEYAKVYQKDVNNYVMVTADGKVKSKGAYVKKLNDLDYDLPIVNRAMVDYMVKGVPVEITISKCDELKEFQMIKKISNKYETLIHGDFGSGVSLKEKCVRVFASKRESDGGLIKVHGGTGRPAKVENTPGHCFIHNECVNGVKCPERLDKQWYIELARRRLEGFRCNR